MWFVFFFAKMSASKTDLLQDILKELLDGGDDTDVFASGDVLEKETLSGKIDRIVSLCDFVTEYFVDKAQKKGKMNTSSKLEQLDRLKDEMFTSKELFHNKMSMIEGIYDHVRDNVADLRVIVENVIPIMTADEQSGREIVSTMYVILKKVIRVLRSILDSGLIKKTPVKGGVEKRLIDVDNLEDLYYSFYPDEDMDNIKQYQEKIAGNKHHQTIRSKASAKENITHLRDLFSFLFDPYNTLEKECLEISLQLSLKMFSFESNERDAFMNTLRDYCNMELNGSPDFTGRRLDTFHTHLTSLGLPFGSWLEKYKFVHTYFWPLDAFQDIVVSEFQSDVTKYIARSKSVVEKLPRNETVVFQEEYGDDETTVEDFALLHCRSNLTCCECERTFSPTEVLGGNCIMCCTAVETGLCQNFMHVKCDEYSRDGNSKLFECSTSEILFRQILGVSKRDENKCLCKTCQVQEKDDDKTILRRRRDKDFREFITSCAKLVQEKPYVFEGVLYEPSMVSSRTDRGHADDALMFLESAMFTPVSTDVSKNTLTKWINDFKSKGNKSLVKSVRDELKTSINEKLKSWGNLRVEILKMEHENPVIEKVPGGNQKKKKKKTNVQSTGKFEEAPVFFLIYLRLIRQYIELEYRASRKFDTELVALKSAIKTTSLTDQDPLTVLELAKQSKVDIKNAEKWFFLRERLRDDLLEIEFHFRNRLQVNQADISYLKGYIEAIRGKTTQGASGFFKITYENVSRTSLFDPCAKENHIVWQSPYNLSHGDNLLLTDETILSFLAGFVEPDNKSNVKMGMSDNEIANRIKNLDQCNITIWLLYRKGTPAGRIKELEDFLKNRSAAFFTESTLQNIRDERKKVHQYSKDKAHEFGGIVDKPEIKYKYIVPETEYVNDNTTSAPVVRLSMKIIRAQTVGTLYLAENVKMFIVYLLKVLLVSEKQGKNPIAVYRDRVSWCVYRNRVSEISKWVNSFSASIRNSLEFCIRELNIYLFAPRDNAGDSRPHVRFNNLMKKTPDEWTDWEKVLFNVILTTNVMRNDVEAILKNVKNKSVVDYNSSVSWNDLLDHYFGSRYIEIFAQMLGGFLIRFITSYDYMKNRLFVDKAVFLQTKEDAVRLISELMTVVKLKVPPVVSKDLNPGALSTETLRYYGGWKNQVVLKPTHGADEAVSVADVDVSYFADPARRVCAGFLVGNLFYEGFLKADKVSDDMDTVKRYFYRCYVFFPRHHITENNPKRASLFSDDVASFASVLDNRDEFDMTMDRKYIVDFAMDTPFVAIKEYIDEFDKLTRDRVRVSRSMMSLMNRLGVSVKDEIEVFDTRFLNSLSYFYETEVLVSSGREGQSSELYHPVVRKLSEIFRERPEDHQDRTIITETVKEVLTLLNVKRLEEFIRLHELRTKYRTEAIRSWTEPDMYDDYLVYYAFRTFYDKGGMTCFDTMVDMLGLLVPVGRSSSGSLSSANIDFRHIFSNHVQKASIGYIPVFIKDIDYSDCNNELSMLLKNMETYTKRKYYLASFTDVEKLSRSRETSIVSGARVIYDMEQRYMARGYDDEEQPRAGEKQQVAGEMNVNTQSLKRALSTNDQEMEPKKNRHREQIVAVESKSISERLKEDLNIRETAKDESPLDRLATVIWDDKDGDRLDREYKGLVYVLGPYRYRLPVFVNESKLSYLISDLIISSIYWQLKYGRTVREELKKQVLMVPYHVIDRGFFSLKYGDSFINDFLESSENDWPVTVEDDSELNMDVLKLLRYLKFPSDGESWLDKRFLIVPFHEYDDGSASGVFFAYRLRAGQEWVLFYTVSTVDEPLEQTMNTMSGLLCYIVYNFGLGSCREGGALKIELGDRFESYSSSGVVCHVLGFLSLLRACDGLLSGTLDEDAAIAKITGMMSLFVSYVDNLQLVDSKCKEYVIERSTGKGPLLVSLSLLPYFGYNGIIINKDETFEDQNLALYYHYRDPVLYSENELDTLQDGAWITFGLVEYIVRAIWKHIETENRPPKTKYLVLPTIVYAGEQQRDEDDLFKLSYRGRLFLSEQEMTKQFRSDGVKRELDNLNGVKYLLVPLFQVGVHFSLVVVDLDMSAVFFVDPNHSGNVASSLICVHAEEIIKKTIRDMKLANTGPGETTSIVNMEMTPTSENLITVNKQTDGYNCGIFVMQYITRLMIACTDIEVKSKDLIDILNKDNANTSRDRLIAYRETLRTYFRGTTKEIGPVVDQLLLSS